MKIYCNKCKKYNPKCNHNDGLLYRVVVHIPGTKNSTKIKTMISKNYEDVVKESIDVSKVLEEFYLNPSILNVVKKGMLNIKVFG